ncbi:MAG: hypothetical protein ACTSW1_15155 [Candidatus Hodarchaeales archaeon]
MYDIAFEYYDKLNSVSKNKKIKELLPIFLDIAGRKFDQLKLKKPSLDQVNVLSWLIALTIDENEEVTHSYYLQMGDVFLNMAKELLEGTHLIGKEEKWENGLKYIDEAIIAYKAVKMDKKSCEKILAAKLKKIEYLLSIDRLESSLEEAGETTEFFDSQPDKIRPFNKKELSLRIGKIFSKAAIHEVKAKHYDNMDVLRISTVGAFKDAKQFSLIIAFLWELAQIVEEHKNYQKFFELTNITFKTTGQYEKNRQEEILNYLESKGRELCTNILNSRMLMVKKGPIEFNNNEGVRYLEKAIELADQINNETYPLGILEFLFEYARDMFEKKIKIRALPYLEFTAKKWFDYSRQDLAKQSLDFIEAQFQELLTQGKITDASPQLGTLFDILMYIGKTEEAGSKALGFSKAASAASKFDIEFEFLDRSFKAFKTIKDTDKLQELLDALIEKSDPLFGTKNSLLNKYLDLGHQVSKSISKLSEAQFLKALTFKSLNSGMIDLAKDTIPKAFEAYKTLDEKEAADIYFQVGSLLLESDIELALDYISKSTSFAKQFESLSETIDRNLDYIKDQTLLADGLTRKTLLITNLEKICSMVDRKEVYDEFLFEFVKNLGEKDKSNEYFETMLKYLKITFETFLNKGENHPKLAEIILWTKKHVFESYNLETQINQIFDLSSLLLDFLQSLERKDEIVSFYWDIFELYLSGDHIVQATKFYRNTQQKIKKFERTESLERELTTKTIDRLNRQVKPIIQDEKFDEAWQIIQELYSILYESDLQKQAFELFVTNAAIFSNFRLDLALTMWNQALEGARETRTTEIFDMVHKTITEETIPKYSEEENIPAVNQLYSLLIEIEKDTQRLEEISGTLMEAAKLNLALGNFNGLQKWGKEIIILAREQNNKQLLFEITDMYFAIGKNLLQTDTKTAMIFITQGSEALRSFGEVGFARYCEKLGDMYEELYNTPKTQSLAINERENIIKHYKNTGMKKEEAKFLTTSAKLSFQAGNISEGLKLISKATDIFQELNDEDGLSDIVTVCLKTAAKYQIGTTEYTSLSKHASSIQESTHISEEKTSDAFGDIFDSMLDDMTSLMDPKKRKKRFKKKK